MISSSYCSRLDIVRFSFLFLVWATPSLTEGPYCVDEMLNRSDIRVDPSDGSIQEGFPLRLGITVSQIDSGIISPLTGAYVDIWHCNALGIYSDVQPRQLG